MPKAESSSGTATTERGGQERGEGRALGVGLCLLSWQKKRKLNEGWLKFCSWAPLTGEVYLKKGENSPKEIVVFVLHSVCWGEDPSCSAGWGAGEWGWRGKGSKKMFVFFSFIFILRVVRGLAFRCEPLLPDSVKFRQRVVSG